MERRKDSRDPTTLRVSDEDRHRVTEVLRLAAGEGRIDLEELDERLEATYSAKTYGDLIPITADLPAHNAPSAAPHALHPAGLAAPDATAYSSSVGVLSDGRRGGRWLVPQKHTAFAMMGTVHLDLREAAFSAPEVTIDAYAVLGEVKIVVNADTRVVVDGVAVLAEFAEGRHKVPARLVGAAQTVRVNGLAVLGSVTVARRPMSTETRKRIGWRR